MFRFLARLKPAYEGFGVGEEIVESGWVEGVGRSVREELGVDVEL